MGEGFRVDFGTLDDRIRVRKGSLAYGSCSLLKNSIRFFGLLDLLVLGHGYIPVGLTGITLKI
jgi:hypothetical protein